MSRSRWPTGPTWTNDPAGAGYRALRGRPEVRETGLAAPAARVDAGRRPRGGPQALPLARIGDVLCWAALTAWYSRTQLDW